MTAVCRCGQVAIDLVGPPILSAVCYCESCRSAGRQFEQTPGAPPVVNAAGGVDYCLYRKDRVKIARGEALLREHRLAPAAATRRMLATCCNAPMFLDFTNGHWLTVYRDRCPEDAPKPQMGVMTNSRPDGAPLPTGIPTYSAYPAKFMLKLLAAWAAMGFRRPKIAW
jgi:hypothetical protein